MAQESLNTLPAEILFLILLQLSSEDKCDILRVIFA